jgi:hypothetical protein
MCTAADHGVQHSEADVVQPLGSAKHSAATDLWPQPSTSSTVACLRACTCVRVCTCTRAHACVGGCICAYVHLSASVISCTHVTSCTHVISCTHVMYAMCVWMYASSACMPICMHIYRRAQLPTWPCPAPMSRTAASLLKRVWRLETRLSMSVEIVG